uniref:Uncharacterized protein n=1 Tax=Panagrolaimus davidi TaxID=227884 RepID=A0A914QFW9_9BILA
MQKLMNYFSSRFAASMQEHFEREVKKLTAITDEIENEEDELGITEEPEYVEPKTTTPKFVKKVIIKPKRKHKSKLRTTKTSTLTSTSTSTTTTTTTTTPSSVLLTTEINEEENSIPNVEDYETTTTNDVETDVDNSETETTDSEYFETTTTMPETEYPEVTDTTEEPESMAFYPFVTSNHGCVQMDSNYNETGNYFKCI